MKLNEQALEAAKDKLDATFDHWRSRCPFDLHFLLEKCIETYESALSSLTPPLDGGER